MTSNFDFLRNSFANLFNHAIQAEKLVNSAPRASCFYARFTLEQAVLWLYDNDNYLQRPYDINLASLIHEQTFKDNLKPGLFDKVRTIHKIGNLAAHDSQAVTNKDALHLIKELFHFLYWLCRYYCIEGKNLGEVKFDSKLIPATTDTLTKDLNLVQIQELETKLSETEKHRKQTEQELIALRQEIAILKQQNETIPDYHDYQEADTRRYLIDILLKEAGWPIDQPEWTRYEVTGMPNQSGKGYVDYVLWGDNGKPLALVEAKRTNANPSDGKHQAKLYADCLERQFQQRPIIFYSNGYEHWLWDDLVYPPRQIQGFFKKDELERMIFRRTNRQSLELTEVNSTIAGRNYQIDAIRRITKVFETKKSRKALLVMATGTGKTRVAIALIDLLRRAGWVKRVLFLADRNALLTQAERAFKTHLPSVTTIDLTRDKNANTTDVVLSTYPTMFNCIENLAFGSGHFDLIIIDESHRSIYQKYQALFTYFDGLLVGLTATPRGEVHRDTYKMFEQDPGVPTFAYELDQAIANNYLVPPRGIKVAFKFLRYGVKYKDLSPEEQQEYEEKFRDEDTGEIPNEVNAAALNQWLFNINTVDQALQLLMEKGIKIDGGERLGKTIIFARNHNHAELIVECFDRNYPQYKGKFAQIIDSHNSYAQSLLDDFSIPEKEPTIAVSVDMLDTGVDIPEVVNLVFFKPIYSRVKFNQMIGPGTRLCKNLFGFGQYKQEFYIFDLCSNFEYFSEELQEQDFYPSDNLTTRLVKTRLKLNEILCSCQSDQPELETLNNTLLDILHQHITTMEKENFQVRPYLKQVEEFSNRELWNNLTVKDREKISTNLANLPNTLPREDPSAKGFDLLCLKLQLSILKQSKQFDFLRDQVRDLMDRLEEKRNIPMIQAQLPLIADVQLASWWTHITINEIENLRLSIRDLIKFIDPQYRQVVYTDFQDELGEVSEEEIPLHQTGFNSNQYRKKVEAFIRANEDCLAIAKLKQNLPLTETDLDALEQILFKSEEIESYERFKEIFGDKTSLKLFIRKLVGLDRNVAKLAFADYLEGSRFTTNQIHFIENIIDYLTQNGVMNPTLLYEPPFTEIHSQGLDGLFPDQEAEKIISIISSFNATVEAVFQEAA